MQSTRMELAFGSYGLSNALRHGLTSRNRSWSSCALLAVQNRSKAKSGLVFSDKPVTKKCNEVPMGSGKGAPDHYVAVIRPGTTF